MNLVPFRTKMVPVTNSLDAVMGSLATFGHVVLGQYGTSHNGWHCSVELRVPTQGAEFKVRSAYDLGTPLEAAQQCLDRVHDVITKGRP